MATTEQQPVSELSAPRLRIRISGFVFTIQAMLFLAHWFVYETVIYFWPELHRELITARILALLLSVSFVTASLLAYHYVNPFVRGFYRVTAVWLGFLNFFVIAACLSWIVALLTLLFQLPLPRQSIAAPIFGLAALTGIYGLFNANWLRVKRIAIGLPNLPPAWRGRVAAVVSDVHLGNVNGARFLHRIIRKLQHLKPDVVFVPGDLYDGSHANLDSLAAPWKQLAPPFGIYFVTGNHEEFSDRRKYLNAVARSGIRVLNNERVTLDGFQLIGVHDSDSADSERFREILESANLDPRRASILLTHIPRRLSIAARAGVSLQISGHTHGGQIFPFTWFTHRIFRPYTHGLQRFGDLLVYTSSGVGTWGPPMRVGSHPEIVLLEFTSCRIQE